MQAEINGHKLNYTVKGSDTGLPVVFIHGFPFSHRMWDPQLAALPPRFRGIAYDIRGHGLSEPGDGQFSIEFFVDDLISLLDYLDAKQVVLCGLSMGGYITLRAVERHPKRFKAMILCDTRSEADTNEGKIKRAETISAIKSSGVYAFAEGFLKLVLAPETFENHPVVADKVRGMIVTNSPRGVCGTLLALAGRTDTTPALKKMNIPALILVGENDVLTPPADAEKLQAQLPNAELHIVPHAAHMSNLENIPFFNERMLAFLDSF
jgi:3-oxoadipate enol-lactonase